MTAHSTATRHEPGSGALEEIAYFGDEPTMWGSTHVPAGETVGGVVICSSTHAELLKSYHLELLLARELAARGLAVQRFHYRGDGNSSGSDEDLALPAMITGAEEARRRLETRTGVSPVAFVGVRLGSFPASRLAMDVAGSALMLWDPVLDADVFIREAVRGHAIAAMAGDTKREKMADLMERLRAEGTIELIGYQITSRFYDSLAGMNLADLVPTGSRALVVPFDKADMSPLLDVWSAGGVEVATLEGDNKEAWWLDEQASDTRSTKRELLVRRSADWIVGRLGS